MGRGCDRNDPRAGATDGMRDARLVGRPSRFDYRFAVEEDIVRLGQALIGRRLGSIPTSRFLAETEARGKGEVGAAIESHFGIPPNSRSEADFPGAGIELKIVPVIRSGRGYRIKERTVITMINYVSIVKETWATAHVRSKLAIYFIFFEHLPGRPKGDFPVIATHLWRARGQVEEMIRADWENVQRKVAAGLAHELSESDGRLMGPCTKGADSSRRVPQPVTELSPTAKPRAFALKPSFTLTLFRETSPRRGNEESLLETLLIQPNSLEEEVLDRFRAHAGRRLGELAIEFDVPTSTNKSYAAGVVRRIAGAKSSNSRIREFEQMGLNLRTPRIGPDDLPYEAVSFPAFKHLELIEEEWVDSTLLSQLDGLLIAPLRGSTRGTPPEVCTLVTPFIWRPSPDELAVVEKEWTMFRDMIRDGKADKLPTEAVTEMIHIRPHGRNADDTDVAPVVGPLTKKSFWLNKRFVQHLISSRGAVGESGG